MGRKMKSAPVYFTIAQVRFNPILSVETYAPQIQDRLRKEGFPDFQKAVLATINLNVNVAPTSEGSPPPQLPMAQAARFVFGNMERTSGFILDQGALSFQTTEYDVFETFLEALLKGLQAVNESVSLSYTDRIGLRYLDAVFPKSGETVRDYLSASILGLTEKIDDTIVHSFSETLVKREEVNVRSRVIIQDGEMGFPPDLQPMTLKVGERFTQLRGRHAIIDTDGWSEAREPFNVDRIRQQLGSIHAGIEKTFRASVTENALKAWE
jgi:uncharacterized protein (TIGR04255 family)